MNVEIYALTEPDSGEVRYIGKANNAQKRFKSHLSETRRKTPVYCWIGSLRVKGQVPGLKVIAVCDADNWCDVEREAIATARRDGVRLLNIADGGDEPYCSYEVRAANARKVTKLRTSDPRKAKLYRLKRDLGQLLQQGYVGERTKEKLRQAAKRHPELLGEYAAL